MRAFRLKRVHAGVSAMAAATCGKKGEIVKTRRLGKRYRRRRTDSWVCGIANLFYLCVRKAGLHLTECVLLGKVWIFCCGCFPFFLLLHWGLGSRAIINYRRGGNVMRRKIRVQTWKRGGTVELLSYLFTEVATGPENGDILFPVGEMVLYGYDLRNCYCDVMLDCQVDP